MLRLKTTKIKILAASLKENWWIIAIASLSLISLYFFGPNLLKLFNSRRENNFKIGIVGNYTLQTLPKEIESKITMGLTRVSQEGEALPGGALDWQIKNEGKTYTFNLDPTLKWHNGKPFTAEDVNYNFEGVEETILSPHQIQFDLQEAFAPFPIRTSEALFIKGIIGLGDFKIKSLETRLGDILSKLELVPNYKNINQTYTFEFFPTEENLKKCFFSLRKLKKPGA
jgi:ABC-type dipeptide transport system, periplasmic component